MAKIMAIHEETIKCLGEHLKAATEIFQGLGFSIGGEASERRTPVAKPKKRESHRDKVANYKNLVATGKRGKKRHS